MKLKIPLTIKQLLYLIIFILVGFILCASVIIAVFMISKSDQDWLSAAISAVGNIIGGIFGGIIAVIAATYQINRTLKNEELKQLENSINLMRLVKEELRDILIVLESAVPYSVKNHQLIVTQTTDETWRAVVYKLRISDKALISVNISYKKLSLIKALNPDEITDDLLRGIQHQFNRSINDVDNEIKDLGKRLKF